MIEPATNSSSNVQTSTFLFPKSYHLLEYFAGWEFNLAPFDFVGLSDRSRDDMSRNAGFFG
jgi:hypothetical protein